MTNRRGGKWTRLSITRHHNTKRIGSTRKSVAVTLADIPREEYIERGEHRGSRAICTYYRIKDWSKHFENNRTKEMVNMRWVPVPNKHDGEGFSLIMEQRDGLQIYACWHLILQVASKCPLERGTLLRDDGTPHDAESIARKCRCSDYKAMQRALDFCSSSQVAWIERLGKEPAEIPHEGAGCLRGREGKGIEGNGIEEKNTSLASLADFDAFWESYPKKTGKKAALKAWRNAKDKPILDAIINAVNIQKQSEQWTKDAGQYIPNPATWINQGRWDDEAVALSKSYRKVFVQSQKITKDKLITQYQRDILNCHTRDEAIRFIDKIHAELKDVVAEGHVMDAWTSNNRGAK